MSPRRHGARQSEHARRYRRRLKTGLFLRQRFVPFWVVEIQCRRYQVLHGALPPIPAAYVCNGGDLPRVALLYGLTMNDVREAVREILWEMFRRDKGHRWGWDEGWPMQEVPE